MTKGVLQMALVVSVVSQIVPLTPALSDVVSPRISNKDKKYSTEAPNISYFGRGPAARLTEASHCRFEGEKELADGNLELAIKYAAKAVQLDPGDPTSHLLYARALTAKFYNNPEGTVDEKLLAKCHEEWVLLWRHDADQSEQQEARIQAKRLAKIAKTIAKQRAQEQKQQNQAIADAKKEMK